MKREELIERAEIIYEELKGKGSADFLSFIEDMISTIEKKGYTEQEGVSNFLEVIYNVSETNIEIIGGGKSLKYKYKSFVSEFLNIKKHNGNYVMKNEYLNELSLEELKFVFSWARRILKAEEDKYKLSKQADLKNSNYKHNKNKNNTSKKNKEVKSKNDFEDSPFAKLKGLKF